MLFNEPKLLKFIFKIVSDVTELVSVLFNEPKLLKSITQAVRIVAHTGSFSALQRAEIAEIGRDIPDGAYLVGVSVLFNEPKLLKSFALLAYSQERNAMFQCSSTSRNC